MRIPRFHIGQTRLAPGIDTELPDAAARHAIQVLRMRPGASLVLFNGDGQDYSARLISADRRRAMVRIEACTPNDTESPLQTCLIQAVGKTDHMDLAIQKTVELGVKRIHPVISVRGVSLPQNRMTRKIDHWRKIAISACEQCGRSTVPLIEAPLPLQTWLSLPRPEKTLRLMLDPHQERHLSDMPRPQAAVEILIGPEGGLSEEECHKAMEAGFIGLRLGSRVLRTETAAIAALAVIQALWGDLA